MDEVQKPDTLLLGVSSAMACASAALCDLKLGMDRYARGYVGQPFLDDWMGTRDTCAYWGDELLRLVIPFLGWERREGKAFQAYVDPHYVLGASIKGLPEHVPEKEVPERIARYAAVFGSRDHVLYIWYKPLGIFTAHEGKHRVAFMRAHHQPTIAAWVQEANYPSASRIVVIEPEEPGEAWLAVLDGRYVQVLRRPRVSLTMLQAYGAKICRWCELSDVPSQARVMSEIYRRGLHQQPRTLAEEDRTLDLDGLSRRERADDEIVVRSMHDLKPYRFVWRRYGAATAGCLTLALIMRLLPWPAMHAAAWICGGAFYGLLCGPLMLRFSGPRRVVGGPPSWDT